MLRSQGNNRSELSAGCFLAVDAMTVEYYFRLASESVPSCTAHAAPRLGYLHFGKRRFEHLRAQFLFSLNVSKRLPNCTQRLKAKNHTLYGFLKCVVAKLKVDSTTAASNPAIKIELEA